MDKHTFLLVLTLSISAGSAYFLIFKKTKYLETAPVYKFTLIAVLLMSVIASFVLLRILGGKALVMTVAGPCVIFSAFMDYDWFMKNPKAAPLVAALGRDGARALYIFFGLVIFFLGLMSLIKVSLFGFSWG